MSARALTPTARVRLRAPEAQARMGGESRPFEYPHLYQIQAGDWRISYAVERNRLAILVLEVLNADGAVAPDPVRESLTRKMKVKLLDWPEGSPSRDLPPEELGKKVKIKLLDMVDEEVPELTAVARSPRVRLAPTKARRSRLAVRMDGSSDDSQGEASRVGPVQVIDVTEAKLTPLDSPTM